MLIGTVADITIARQVAIRMGSMLLNKENVTSVEPIIADRQSFRAQRFGQKE